MTFSYLTRRTHLYLGLSLLPWLVMYGVSALPFSHGAWIEKTFADGKPNWVTRFERPYTIDLPANGEFRATGEQMMRDAGVAVTAYGTYRYPAGQLEVYRYDFRGATRLTYDPDRHTLKVEDSRFQWWHYLAGMHARGGFHQPFAADRAWAVTVDAVCAALLLWAASGLYLWWQIPAPHRRWGAVALLAGSGSFVLYLLRL